MPAKKHFTKKQQELLRATARKLWRDKFAWMKKATKDHPAGQEAMALALGISQQTISSLIAPDSTYNPGFKVATALANLSGMRLHDLIGEYEVEVSDAEEGEQRPAQTAPTKPVKHRDDTFHNLTVCLEFSATTKQWSPWTVAAARAGFFGNSDFPAPAWIEKLDLLEKILERGRKAT